MNKDDYNLYTAPVTTTVTNNNGFMNTNNETIIITMMTIITWNNIDYVIENVIYKSIIILM